MQTQGISLNASAVQSLSSGKASRTGSSTFDRFMSQNAAQKQDSVQGKMQGDQSRNEIRSSSEEFNRHKVSLTSGKQSKEEWTEAVDLEEISNEVVSVLKETFGMSEEDIVDILEQLGMVPADLVFSVAENGQNLNFLNIENMKALVLEVHGVDDANLFLTSDTMSDELNQIMTGIQNLLEEALGMDLEQLSQGDEVLLQSFAEKFAQLAGDGSENAENLSADDPTQNVAQNAADAQTTDEIPVVVETEGESGFSDTYGQTLDKSDSRSVDQKPNESPLNAFVERLSQSFEDVSQTEAASARELMTDIVDQVVNHIRIRVLPQTTSMELQLNPESLGRVNLNVTSQNGTATATLTVQNQVAKEALESQIAVLKENLESHGLKVDSVEVNVSEFGFKKQEDSNNSQYKQRKSQGRRMRLDAGREMEEIPAEIQEETHSGDSVVDYTA